MSKGRSPWLLVIFCTIATLIAALALAGVFAGASVAFAVAGGSSRPNEDRPTGTEAANPAPQAVSQTTVDTSPQETFSGIITDSHCRARHAPSFEKNPSECTLLCIRNGSEYALVNGDRSFRLQGDSNELGKLAGERVNLVGSLARGVIKVSSVSEAR